MANMEGPGHLLSLKVMRVSRPALAASWQPFYSSSPSFSAHSTAAILSLQGNTPLPGTPKTLRDLTHASDLLVLPSSFGSIQLGETFSSCLCVNNEANVDIDHVTMTVEMQTATSKIALAEFGGQDFHLAAGDTLENVVHHEIKELGQHVLACSVSYKMPPSSRLAGAQDDVDQESVLQTFRKFYKFAVTNPLSVKTKVHIPRSPSALLSPLEREKVFLEVHIQNLTQESLWFERMHLDCAEGWSVDDANMVAGSDSEPPESLFSGSMALMQPQDMRQYIYVLTPTSIPLAPISYNPGDIIALGRLDISWRSSFGEPGRLLTSMLSRRIPLPQPPVLQPPVLQPASALPQYLKRTSTTGPSSTPPRPHSPQLSTAARPVSPPPHRPGSPYRARSIQGSARSQSPGPLSSSAVQPALPQSTSAPADIDVNLIVRHIERESISVEKPFTVSFALTVSSMLPAVPLNRRRIVSLIVQHVLPPRVAIAPVPPAAPLEAFSPRLPSSGFSTPSPTVATFNYALAHQKLLLASPRKHQSFYGDIAVDDALALPLPFADGPDELKLARPVGVVFVGASAVPLPSITLSASADANANASATIKADTVQEFELTYLPIRKGFWTLGALRVILVEDKFSGNGDVDQAEDQADMRKQAEIRTLKQWDTVGEVWVKS